MLETQRLILRPLVLEDALDLLEYQSNSEVVRYTPWPVRNIDEVLTSLEKITNLHRDFLIEEADSMFLAWELKESGKVIGQSNSTLISSTPRICDIGWATHQEYQGKGFALEATETLLNHLFLHHDISKVLAKIDSRNLKSLKFAESLGMTSVGLAATQQIKGEDCQILTYEIGPHP